MEWQDHMAVLFLVFWWISILASLMVRLIYIPNDVQGFLFPHILTNIYFLDDGLLASVRWNPIIVFIWISLMAKDVEHIFMFLLGICTCSFETIQPAYLSVLSLDYLSFVA
jgi:hypothetical protein